MRDKEYLKPKDGQLCAYHYLGGCMGDVVFHHIRVKGLCGVGLKMEDEFTIPVCWLHHRACDARTIPTHDQLKEMLWFWFGTIAERDGLAPALQAFGDAYVAILKGGNNAESV